MLGKEHPLTLTSVSNLAGVLQYQGKYEAAEAMNRRALEGREKVLGKEHPDTLSSVNIGRESMNGSALRFRGRMNGGSTGGTVIKEAGITGGESCEYGTA